MPRPPPRWAPYLLPPAAAGGPLPGHGDARPRAFVVPDCVSWDTSRSVCHTGRRHVNGERGSFGSDEDAAVERKADQGEQGEQDEAGEERSLAADAARGDNEVHPRHAVV